MVLNFANSPKQKVNLVCVCDPNEDANVDKAVEIGYDISMAKADIKWMTPAEEGDKFDIHYYQEGKDVHTYQIEIKASSLIQAGNQATVLNFAEIQPHTEFVCGL